MAAADGMASPHPARDPEDPFSRHHNAIKEMVQEGHTDEEIVAALGQEGLITSERSLQRRLQLWDIRRPGGIRGKRINRVTNKLTEAVNHLFHHTTLNDTQLAARCLTDYNIETTARQVKTIRSLNRWLRASTGPLKAAQRVATQQHVERAILNGPARSFGRRWFTSYLRQEFGYRARRDDVAVAQQQLDPEGVAQRLPGPRRPRQENYTTPGPNFLWCLDGHDKLSQYGFEIYAAVDAYSRKIIWFYCGNTNRTAISVVKQYFLTVSTLGICPRFIRTDKGTETVLLADLHFSLYIEAALREEWSEEDYQAVRISDCYIYGPSTRNIRVEGLWRQQRFQCTAPWLLYFQTLQAESLYRQDQLADQVVILFLFMPILRQELNTFVSTHNAHPIRRQNNRSMHVPGAPDELYRGEQRGFAVNREVLTALQDTLPEYGKPTSTNKRPSQLMYYRL